ncbi:MAG: hypothetical protein ABIF40_04495 [archaeon]
MNQIIKSIGASLASISLACLLAGSTPNEYNQYQDMEWLTQRVPPYETFNKFRLFNGIRELRVGKYNAVDDLMGLWVIQEQNGDTEIDLIEYRDFETGETLESLPEKKYNPIFWNQCQKKFDDAHIYIEEKGLYKDLELEDF